MAKNVLSETITKHFPVGFIITAPKSDYRSSDGALRALAFFIEPNVFALSENISRNNTVYTYDQH